MGYRASRHHHILVVEDEPVTRATLAGYFKGEGYTVSEASDCAEADDVFRNNPIDLILLDIALPGEDGLSFLREIRRISEVGIILVTGKTDDLDRIIGLEMGADDYVAKPFNPRELLARVKNLIHRTVRIRELTERENLIRFAGWVLDIPKRALTAPDGKVVRLTRGEFELLSAMAKNRGRVMTRDSLLDHVSHRDWNPNDRSIDVLVGRLRKKIENDPTQPAHIITVHGVGYAFVSDLS